jgi:hypothetical protein
MPQESHDPELELLARNLSALVPAPGALNRDRVLFRAGQASTRGSIFLWRVGTLTALVAGAAIFFADRFGSTLQPAERLVYVQVEAPVKSTPKASAADSFVAMATSSPASEQNHFREDSPFSAHRLQEAVLRNGFEGLPNSSVVASPGPVLSADDWWQDRFSDLLKP